MDGDSNTHHAHDHLTSTTPKYDPPQFLKASQLHPRSPARNLPASRPDAQPGATSAAPRAQHSFPSSLPRKTASAAAEPRALTAGTVSPRPARTPGSPDSATSNASSIRSTRIPKPASRDSPASARQPRHPKPSTQTNKENQRPGSARSQGRASARTTSSEMRQPMGMAAAFRLAQQESAQKQDDDTFDLKQAFQMASAEVGDRIDGSPSPAPRSFRSRPQSRDANHQDTFIGRKGAGGGLAQHLQQFDRKHQLGKDAPPAGLFSRANAPAQNTESQQRPSLGSMVSAPPALQPSYGAQPDQPLPSVESHSPAKNISNSAALSGSLRPSPEKSFNNWELEGDFTAGDLQVSDSPLIRASKTNRDASRPSPTEASKPHERTTPPFRRSNDRLDRIRERETEAAGAHLTDDGTPPPRRGRTKLDEIRAREMQALSKRAVATSRLDEIRVRNSEARSLSPELNRTPEKESLVAQLPDAPKDDAHLGPASKDNEKDTSVKKQVDRADADEKAAGTPATARRGSYRSTRDPENARQRKTSTGTLRQEPQSPSEDPNDLLRRLAQATSPLPETTRPGNVGAKTEEIPQETNDQTSSSRLPAGREARSRRTEAKGPTRPTVGFVGLRRAASSDSLVEKKSSRGSETDPQDRIDSEALLFAPQDNYSERGSVRAPSPIPDTADEVTPRAPRIDPLTLPTPRVTGAYVETPATVKVKSEDSSGDKVASDTILHAPDVSSRIRNRNGTRRPGLLSRAKRGEDEGGPSSQGRSSSVPARRRARSLSRRQSPLVNSATPPSVREDLRAILLAQQIEDSTLEDIDEKLKSHHLDEQEHEAMVNDDGTLKGEDDEELLGGVLTESDWIRLGNKLGSTVEGLRTAKQGIERLEDQVLHKDHHHHQPSKAHPEHEHDESGPAGGTGLAAYVRGKPPGGADAVVVRVPTLFDRSSRRLRPTRLGVAGIAVVLWYVLELVFSHMYAAPPYDCSSSPHHHHHHHHHYGLLSSDGHCDWSPNEPYYPYAMPFMLDEWATGGRGRRALHRLGEEAGDRAADLADWATGSDLTQRDPRYMTVWQRKRHARRLHRRGLGPKWAQPRGYRARYSSQWQAARDAREAYGGGEEEEEDNDKMSMDETIG